MVTQKLPIAILELAHVSPDTEVTGEIESFMGSSEGWNVCNNPAPVAEVRLMTNHPYRNGLTASPSQTKT